VQITDTNDPRYWQPLIHRWLAIYSDRFRFGGRVYDHAGTTQNSKTGMWVSYTAIGY
jgi:hypothetical protein